MTKTYNAGQIVMKAITAELDAESYDWLMANRPGLCTAVEQAVREEIAPDDIRWHVLRQTQRNELSLRCKQAAMHVARMVQDGL